MTPAAHSALPAWLEPLGDEVFAIDTGFHRDRYDAAYLLVDGPRAAYIDTGTAFALPRLLGALDALGLRRDAVDWVIPTHVHLDHAGAVGALVRELPNARVAVHPRGLRHLVDPADLWAGALAVYGPETMARNYGELVPIPAERVVASEDGGTVSVGARTLRFAHTDGHARHHHCIHDTCSQAWFTGDTFGMAPREFVVGGRAFLFPTTTPVQFEPEAMHASIDRLLLARPRQMFVTHYARVGEPDEAARRLKASIDDTVRVARSLRDAPDRHAALTRALVALYADAAQAHGVSRPRAEIEALLHDDAALNAAGLEVWLNRSAR